MAAPKSSDVLRALRQHVNAHAHSMRRLTTGLAHYVYEVMTDGEPVVVRMADPDYHNGIPGGVYWHKRLRPLGVPLPNLLGYDLDGPFPYMILERLRGVDLGQVYAALSASEIQALARQIAAIQDRVATLPAGPGFGFLPSYETSFFARSWREVLEAGLAEAQENILAAGIFDAKVVGAVRAAAGPFQRYFDSVQPLPFLDDTTTKNVIVHDGALQGIVDVDAVCFGDRLFVLALTQMALLGDGRDTAYIDEWSAAWGLGAAEHRVVRLYTAFHCVSFMGEVGTAFNKEAPEPFDQAWGERYPAILNSMLEQAGG